MSKDDKKGVKEDKKANGAKQSAGAPNDTGDRMALRGRFRPEGTYSDDGISSIRCSIWKPSSS